MRNKKQDGRGRARVACTWYSLYSGKNNIVNRFWGAKVYFRRPFWPCECTFGNFWKKYLNAIPKPIALLDIFQSQFPEMMGLGSGICCSGIVSAFVAGYNESISGEGGRRRRQRQREEGKNADSMLRQVVWIIFGRTTLWMEVVRWWRLVLCWDWWWYQHRGERNW